MAKHCSILGSMTYADFWLRFLHAHGRPVTRVAHYAGSVLARVAMPDARKPWTSMRPEWIAWALLVGALAGCAAPRPGFLARLQQDCQAGDQDACGLLAGPASATDPQRLSQPVSRPRTAVQRDVDAIMRGMDRTRATPLSQLDPDEGG